MDGLLIFDQQNDIVFTKLNHAAKRKIFDLAKQQELVPDDAVLIELHLFTKLCDIFEWWRSNISGPLGRRGENRCHDSDAIVQSDHCISADYVLSI